MSRPAKRCVVCGAATTRRWCSNECHRADEPEHYEPDACPDCGATTFHTVTCSNHQ